MRFDFRELPGAAPVILSPDKCGRLGPLLDHALATARLHPAARADLQALADDMILSGLQARDGDACVAWATAKRDASPDATSREWWQRLIGNLRKAQTMP
jgi:hypothetical protein